MPLWAGLRLLAIDHKKLTEDPTIGLWLFIIMTQAQVLFSLIGAASPALKKTMMDLRTDYGAQTGSNSNSKPGTFPLKYLKSGRNRSQPTDSERSRTIPYAGAAKGSALISKSRHEDKMTRDDDSQEGIIRQDDFEVSYDAGETSDRYQSAERGYARMR